MSANDELLCPLWLLEQCPRANDPCLVWRASMKEKKMRQMEQQDNSISWPDH